MTSVTFGRHDTALYDVLEEHAEEAAILWEFRWQALADFEYDLDDLAELDERVEAHLDGLRIAGECGWVTCKNLGWTGRGEYFTAMNLAMSHGKRDLLNEVLSEAGGNLEALSGIVSALGWVEANALQGIVKQWLDSENPVLRRIGIAACAIHRVDPGRYLDAALMNSAPELLSRALKAAGELGRNDVLPLVEQHLNHRDEDCRFWAAWAAALLGSIHAQQALKSLVRSSAKYRVRAADILLRAMDLDTAGRWLAAMLDDREGVIVILSGIGALGVPKYIDVLIENMKDDRLCDVAGGAFMMITGVDAGSEDLYMAVSEEDSKQQFDPDKVRNWWRKEHVRFQKNTRYLSGEELNSENCRKLLVTGSQPVRQAAALELALEAPAAALFETRAPGYRQKEKLKSLSMALL